VVGRNPVDKCNPTTANVSRSTLGVTGMSHAESVSSGNVLFDGDNLDFWASTSLASLLIWST
jgi:hypothetical protein